MFPQSVDRWGRLQPETRGKLLRLFAILDGKKAKNHSRLPKSFGAPTDAETSSTSTHYF